MNAHRTARAVHVAELHFKNELRKTERKHMHYDHRSSVQSETPQVRGSRGKPQGPRARAVPKRNKDRARAVLAHPPSPGFVRDNAHRRTARARGPFGHVDPKSTQKDRAHARSFASEMKPKTSPTTSGPRRTWYQLSPGTSCQQKQIRNDDRDHAREVLVMHEDRARGPGHGKAEIHRRMTPRGLHRRGPSCAGSG